MGPFQRAGRETWTHSGNETRQLGNGSRQQHGILFFYESSQNMPGDTVVKNPPANAGDARDAGLIPGLGSSSGEGNGNPLQYSCLEDSIDRGAWQATVHGMAKSWT